MKHAKSMEQSTGYIITQNGHPAKAVNNRLLCSCFYFIYVASQSSECRRRAAVEGAP